MNKELNIIHVHRIRKSIYQIEDGVPHPSDFITVLRSQFSTAKYLQNNSHLPIVSELLYEDLDCNDAVSMCIEAHTIFPKGFFQSIADLTLPQADFLYTHGPEKTLLYLGVLPKIYKAIDKKNTVLQVADDLTLYKEEISEELVVENAKRAADLHYGKDKNGDVIVVFGIEYDVVVKYRFQQAVDFYNYKFTNALLTPEPEEPTFTQALYKQELPTFSQEIYDSYVDMVRYREPTFNCFITKCSSEEIPVKDSTVNYKEQLGLCLSKCLDEERLEMGNKIQHEDL